MPEYISFDEVRSAVSVQQVLDHYGLGNFKDSGIRVSGENIVGRCPLHGGGGFSIHLEKKIFKCFSCGAHGNIFEFVAAMEKLKNGVQITQAQAAMLLNYWFNLGVPVDGSAAVSKDRKSSKPKAPASDPKPKEQAPALDVGEQGSNKPLSFTLKGIDPAHESLAKLGIAKETAEHFGAGFYSGKGSLSGNIVCPVHNEHDQLIAYVGYDPDTLEQKFPKNFDPSQVLYNLNPAIAAIGDEVIQRTVILAGGCLAVMKIWQAGFPFVVGAFKWPLSLIQVAMLETNFERVIMAAGDEDEMEISGMLFLLSKVADIRFVDTGGKEIEQLSTGEIRQLFSAVVR